MSYTYIASISLIIGCGRSGVSYHLLERRARSIVLEHEDKISHPTLSFAFTVQSLDTTLSPRPLHLSCHFMTMHFSFHLFSA